MAPEHRIRRALTLAGAYLLAAGTAFCAVAPAAEPTDTIAAREHFFGQENVGPEGELRRDRVILSWFSVASFAAAIDGHVVLLDTYIHKGEDAPGYVPTTTEELVALRPEAIFLGHGHFDHAATAGEIVGRTGAVLVGTPEHCAQATDEAASLGTLAHPVRCVTAAESADVPGAKRELRPLGEAVEVTSLKHVHSAAEPPDGEGHETSITAAPAPDPSAVLLHPPGPSVVPGLNPAGDEGGTVLYQFRVGGFSLTWHDSAGPLRERGPAIFDALAALPPSDVQVGATLGFNDPTNGMRDPVDYVTTLRPDVFLPNHHDFVAEYGASKGLEGVFRRELAKRGDFPGEIRWLYDPYDYLRPTVMSFDVERRRFADCLPAKARIRPGELAGVRLGDTRDEVRQRAGAQPVTTRRSAESFCVRRSAGVLTAVYGGAGGDAEAGLIATTAETHHQRRIGPGDPKDAALARLPRAERVGPGLYRATPRSPRLIGFGSGEVDLLAIAVQPLLDDPAALRRYLHRGGLRSR